jgi:hypothetical protein
MTDVRPLISMLPWPAAPSVVTRSTLPLSELRFCGLVLRAASPVVIHRWPSGPKRVRQPEWRPLVERSMPVTIGVPPSSVIAADTLKRTTRTSPAVM